VFGIFATIAELERELIRDRVRSGIASASAKGKRIGRPKVVVDASRVAAMRSAGASWDTIRRELSIGKGTAQRAGWRSFLKNRPIPGETG
jgi:putative DNA-invertase from lambdoid prophage Rac